MSSPFSHLLITRFNLDFSDLKITKYGSQVRSAEWLSTRFHLFKTYCLPSVINQVNQSFKWLVFFSHDTPPIYVSEIEHMANGYQNFVPIFISSGSQFLPEIKHWITNNATTEFIITSRLDNDDMIHSNYIRAIQRTFNMQQNCIINIPYGLQFDLENLSGKVITAYNSFGPFISLIERANNAQTVYGREHKNWTNFKHVKTLDQRLWVQIIHSQNVINSFNKRKNYYVHQNVLIQFGVNEMLLTGQNRLTYKMILHNLSVPYFKLTSLLKRICTKVHNAFLKTF